MELFSSFYIIVHIFALVFSGWAETTDMVEITTTLETTNDSLNVTQSLLAPSTTISEATWSPDLDCRISFHENLLIEINPIHLPLKCWDDQYATLQMFFKTGIYTLTPTNKDGFNKSDASEDLITDITCQRLNIEYEKPLYCMFPRFINIEVHSEGDDIIFSCDDGHRYNQSRVVWRVFVVGEGFVDVAEANRAWTRDNQRSLLLRNITMDDHDQFVECRVYDKENIRAIGYSWVPTGQNNTGTPEPEAIDIVEILSIHLDYVILGSAAATSCLLLGAVIGFACLACCMKDLRRDVQIMGWQVERLAIDGMVLSRSQYSKAVDLRPAEKRTPNQGNATHDKEDEDDLYTLPASVSRRLTNKKSRAEVWDEEPGEEYIDMGGNQNNYKIK